MFPTLANNDKRTRVGDYNQVTSSNETEKNKLPEINKKINMDKLTDIFEKLEVDERRLPTITREQQLILDIFEGYDDSEFHSMLYENESSMKSILSLFSSKGYDLHKMTPLELKQLTGYIDREREPWKWNFLLQIISCIMLPDFCYGSDKMDVEYDGNKKRLFSDTNNEDDRTPQISTDDANNPRRKLRSRYNPGNTRIIGSGKKKSKKSRHNSKSKRNKTRRRKTI